MANRWGNNGSSDRLFSCAPKSLWMMTAAMKLKDACSLEEKLWQNLDSILKKQRYHFVDKGPPSQSYGFSDSHVWMWELDHKEGWALKNWCFWIAVLEKTLESPLDCKEIQPVNPKGPTRIIHWKDWCWSSNTLATWCKELTHCERLWCWERLKAGREGDSRGWDGCMASLTQWTWVSENCRK